MLILFNKPYGVICQFSSDGMHPTLKEYLPIPGIYPAGRLDTDSEGLLILTDDGKLQHKISHPRHKLPKPYFAEVEGAPSDAALASLARGVDLGEFVTAPATATRSADTFPQVGADGLARALDHRGQAPSGAAHDGSGRSADAATDPLVGRSLDARRSPRGAMAHGLGNRIAEFQAPGALTGLPNERAMIRRRFRLE